ncbi:MAG TPA: TetR/AcrR family transcriptional regulator [Pseudonocardia sp.]|jgi:AcrR family transcriptional regulator|nr:TetR/AcrR family transcriptional regulator [Pseudonocardia sp.]
MPDASHPTRTLLLDTGLGLADRASLGGFPIDEVVRAAGVAKGTFYVHFPSRTAYLEALHERFHDRLRAAIERATDGLAPGREHLRAGTMAYLDGCLTARGVKAMLASARGEPAIAARVAASNRRFADEAEPDFVALGAARPAERALLFVAMAAEVALLELDRGGPAAELRNELCVLAGMTA